jgi:WD repeat and SOF domain-containing protein 1
MRKFVLSMRSNKVVWNPMEPFNFLLANEDHHIYSFDMRKIEKALMVHKDHVGAVMDVAFSPTGREFVSGGYDRTLRLFKTNEGRSRDMYHTKRMQRIFSVAYSSDSQYVMSGSDDTNVRIWKADASATLGVHKARQDRREQVRDTLKKRYAHMPEIKRISHDIKVPKSIKKAAALAHEQKMEERKKHENRKKHSREDEEVVQPERKRAVIAQLR